MAKKKSALDQLWDDWVNEHPEDNPDTWGPGRLHGFGSWAREGDIVEVIRGKNFPVGMKFVVNRTVPLRFWAGSWHWHKDGDIFLEFIDEGFKPAIIRGDYCKIIALTSDRKDNPLYADVHDVEIMGVKA